MLALQAELGERESGRREARDALRAADAAISQATRALHQLQAESAAARGALAELAARRAAREVTLAQGETALARVLAARALSEAPGGAPAALRLALSGEDPVEAARKLHYLEYLSRATAALIGAQREGLAELARLAEESEARSRALAALEERGRADRERLLAGRRERRRLHDSLVGEIRKTRQEIRTLAADERRLSRLVEEIGRVLAARPGAGFARVERVPEAAAAAGPFSRLKGRLRLPVRGEVSERFAAARGAKGIFIRAPEGETVRAVAAGQVVFADWMRGYGNLLILDHGEDYFSVYANNEALLKQAGDTVAPGEALATVGATAGREETGLYFELRHVGKPFDPLGWARLR